MVCVSSARAARCASCVESLAGAIRFSIVDESSIALAPSALGALITRRGGPLTLSGTTLNIVIWSVLRHAAPALGLVEAVRRDWEREYSCLRD